MISSCAAKAATRSDEEADIAAFFAEEDPPHFLHQVSTRVTAFLQPFLGPTVAVATTPSAAGAVGSAAASTSDGLLSPATRAAATAAASASPATSVADLVAPPSVAGASAAATVIDAAAAAAGAASDVPADAFPATSAAAADTDDELRESVSRFSAATSRRQRRPGVGRKEQREEEKVEGKGRGRRSLGDAARRTDGEGPQEEMSVPAKREQEEGRFGGRQGEGRMKRENIRGEVGSGDRTERRRRERDEEENDETTVQYWGNITRPVALVTSGGMTVPLEKNAVRSISNFSTGQRGAALSEQLLLRGYAVIFLSNSAGAQPFLRHLLQQQHTAAVLDRLQLLPVEEEFPPPQCHHRQQPQNSSEQQQLRQHEHHQQQQPQREQQQRRQLQHHRQQQQHKQQQQQQQHKQQRQEEGRRGEEEQQERQKKQTQRQQESSRTTEKRGSSNESEPQRKRGGVDSSRYARKGSSRYNSGNTERRGPAAGAASPALQPGKEKCSGCTTEGGQFGNYRNRIQRKEDEAAHTGGKTTVLTDGNVPAAGSNPAAAATERTAAAGSSAAAAAEGCTTAAERGTAARRKVIEGGVQKEATGRRRRGDSSARATDSSNAGGDRTASSSRGCCGSRGGRRRRAAEEESEDDAEGKEENRKGEDKKDTIGEEGKTVGRRKKAMRLCFVAAEGTAVHAWEAYQQQKSRLLLLSFDTVVEYLFLWRELLRLCSPLKERLVVFACAAVADFYIPSKYLPQHKRNSRVAEEQKGSPRPVAGHSKRFIPSLVVNAERTSSGGATATRRRAAAAHEERRDAPAAAAAGARETARGGRGGQEAAPEGRKNQVSRRTCANDKCEEGARSVVAAPALVLQLYKVPKMLGLAKKLNPYCCLVSFKLETDAAVLEEKATQSLRLYRSDLVVGNLLHTRHRTVTLFTLLSAPIQLHLQDAASSSTVAAAAAALQQQQQQQQKGVLDGRTGVDVTTTGAAGRQPAAAAFRKKQRTEKAGGVDDAEEKGAGAICEGGGEEESTAAREEAAADEAGLTAAVATQQQHLTQEEEVDGQLFARARAWGPLEMQIVAYVEALRTGRSRSSS